MAETSGDVARTSAAQAHSRPSYYLEDVQGLRTLAALLVAIYHIWVNKVSGGVDVFFVVAAFFMISTLVRREPVSGAAIGQYYSATARRVVPGAMLVIAVTAVASLWLLPTYLWEAQLPNVLWSALMVENVYLAWAAVDYAQGGLSASPFQQFWALCVQVHVYVLFPALYLASSLVARRTGRSPRVVATGVFLAVFVASLAYSIVRTQTNQPQAYFDTAARLWEFGAGALLALWIDRVRLPKVAAIALGWVAVVALVGLGLVVDVTRSFPGYAALAPVLIAAGVIAASANGGANHLLRFRPMVWFADMSFAFYLWHWPVLVFMRHYLGHNFLSVVDGLTVIFVAALLAVASTKWFESPIRRSPLLGRRPLATIAACAAMIFVALGTYGVWQNLYADRARIAEATVAQYLLDPSAGVPPGSLVPDPILARRPNGPQEKTECLAALGAPFIRCEFGNLESPTTIALVGASHSAQYTSAVISYGEARGYRIVTMMRAGCLYVATYEAEGMGNGCKLGNMLTTENLMETVPDLVVTLGTRTAAGSPKEHIPAGYEETWADLTAAGMHVVAIRDNPRFTFNALGCVSRMGPGAARCEVPRARLMAAVPATDGLDIDGVTFVDFTDWICKGDVCPSDQDGLVVYRDDDHLSPFFVRVHREKIWAALDGALAERSASDAL